MPRCIDRYPINPFTDNPYDVEANNSTMSFDNILAYETWIEHWLVDADKGPFRATPENIEMRRWQLQFARGESYVANRDVSEFAKLLGSNVSKVEDEFRRENVLDIGSGIGRFGESLARAAKAKVTFIDTDEEALSKIGPRSGEKLVADGRDLPFADDEFDKTVAMFSSVSWAETPVETALAINEAVRVTTPGGSTFIVPAIGNMHRKVEQEMARMELMRRGTDFKDPESDEGGMKVWVSQDLVVLNSLFNFIRNKRVSVTWSGYLAQGQNTGLELDYYSAIVDKESTIPQEELRENLDFAQRFMPNNA